MPALLASLALAAARAALDDAGIDAASIGLIVLATATPDNTFPATATKVQTALGCNGGVAFDVAAVCSGFLYALSVADSLLKTGMAKRALVIGAETFSRILDWEDRTTCVLFGDGAGAIVLEAQDVADDGPGLLATRLHADGAHNELLYVDGGPSTTGTVGHLRMKGREKWMIPVLMLLFAAGGTSYGMAEETLAFYGLLVPVMIAARMPLVFGRSRSCLVIHSPTSVAPDTMVASGCSAASRASAPGRTMQSRSARPHQAAPQSTSTETPGP